MKNRTLLTTVFSAFNYGSCLQAFAGKQIIQKVGYECDLVKLKSLVKGRDVRFRKLMTILFRSLFLNKNNALKTYGKSYEKTLVDGTERKFFAFTDEYLKPVEVSWRRLKSLAKEAVACFSGSDQIWNSSTLYVDPLYYLRFAPKQKRIALSPSFGRNFIADYNKNKMKKWINDYPYLSVREDSGVKLIKELTGLEAQHLLDPTLIINSEEWRKNLHIAVACFSGSDQIWNSSTLYVDPLYYLRFAPKQKRIALSPSFGRNFIADYNKNKMKKWINDYPYLSVREDSGVKLIKELTGLEAQHLLDPTLIINSEEWRKNLHIEEKIKNYILAYFLDEPSSHAKNALKALKEQLNCKVIALPYKFEDMDYCDEAVAAGPKEFVELVANAKVVCTDSFHGTVFALNLHTPFFTFEREYGFANKQSERVLSILRKVDMLERYQPVNVVEKLDNLDFKHSEEVLNTEREKAYKYVNNAINSIKKNEK